MPDATPLGDADYTRQDERTVLGGSLKRVFDLSFAVTLLVFLLPLLCMIATACLFLQGRPIVYPHRRVGRNGALFPCLKFRTMVRDPDAALAKHFDENPGAREEWAASQKLRADPRVTPLGRLLRKSSLDEIPQLLNIVRGDMSVVGPRPIVVAEVWRYGTEISAYYRTRPGLTGPWQISGRSDTSYAERVRLDTAYVATWSFGNDVMIVLKTIPAVLLSQGSY